MNFVRKALSVPFKLIHFVLSIVVLSTLLGLGIAGLVVLAVAALATIAFGIVALLAWLALALVLGLLCKGVLRVAQVFDPAYAVNQKDRVEELRGKVAKFNGLQEVVH